MSTIVGIYAFDQKAVSAEELTRMSRRLAAHGADGGSSWQQGAVGLAQRQMIITPEDRYERQPCASSDGQLVLVSDARLDNRPELADELHIPATAFNTLADSALILRAYERWGENAPKHLLGDYAFALWDGRQQQLLLARSPLGNRPLYYYHTRRAFAFATMPAGLFALPWVPRDLALENLLDDDPDRTLYRGLKQLSAGYCLLVSQAGIQQHPFWQLDLERRLHFARDEEYVEAFNELFTGAVQSRLRSLYPVGVLMSGGLDSSAVAVTAARLLAQQGQSLSAFTEVPRVGFAAPLPPGKYADETPFVQAIAEMYPNLCLNLVRSDGCGVFADLDRFFAAMYGPFQNVSNRVWIEAIQSQAQAQGVRVLLTGASGNLTVSWRGSNVLPSLLQQGAWRQAWRSARTQSHTRAGAWRAMAGQGLLPLLPSQLQAGIHNLRQIGNRLPFTSKEIPTALHPSLLSAAHKQRWCELQFPVYGSERQQRYDLLDWSTAGNYDAAYAAIFGISHRDPTNDLRLVEFCFAVPEEQWRHGQMTRSLIRRAMADRLPDAVLHNQKRGMQAAGWHESLLAERDLIQADLARLQQNATAQHYLDLPKMQQLAATLPQTGWDNPDIFAQYHWGLLSGLMLGRFILWFEANQAQEPAQ